MEHSRDSSVWRSLAVAFGDGLAFGVGMTLTQKAGRRGAAPDHEVAAPTGRLGELERRIEQCESRPARLDPKALEAVVRAVEQQLHERDAQWAARLDCAVAAVRRDGEEKIAALRKENADAATALRCDVVEDLRALEAQGVALHQEITAEIPKLVDEQIPAQIEARAAEMEARLRAEIGQAVERASAAASEALDNAVDHKLELLLGELERKDREIAELRRSVSAGNRITREMLAGIGRICRDAAEQFAAPAAREEEAKPEPPAAAPPAQPAEPAPATEVPPRFDVAPGRHWSLPLVSSLLIASGCLFWLHWL